MLHKSNIDRVILNGEKSRKNTYLQMIKGIGNKELLAKWGGYIFKYTVSKDTLYLGIIPSIINANRSYHHDIILKIDNEYTLTGGISIHSDFLVTPNYGVDKLPLPDEKKIIFKKSYIRFARWLIENNYSASGRLDWITIKVMEELELFTEIPGDIQSLSFKEWN